VLMGDTARDGVWRRLSEMLDESWTHACGAALPLTRFALDTGFATQEAYGFVRACRDPRLMPLLEQLIGRGPRMVQDMALLKPPFVGAEKPWHQDTAYFDYTPLGGVIGVWVALDEATVENGCMQVIPGSHLDGPAQHYHVRDCQLPDRKVAVERAVVVPLKPGGAMFFSGLIHHGTPPNTSADRRRALQFHYAAANCTKMTIQEHGQWFDDGGAYAGCRDWDLAAGMSRAKIAI